MKIDFFLGGGGVFLAYSAICAVTFFFYRLPSLSYPKDLLTYSMVQSPS